MKITSVPTYAMFLNAFALFKFSDHYHMSIAMAHTGLLGGEIPSGQRWFHGQGNAPPGTMPQWKMGTSLNLNRACPPYLYLGSVLNLEFNFRRLWNGNQKKISTTYSCHHFLGELESRFSNEIFSSLFTMAMMTSLFLSNCGVINSSLASQGRAYCFTFKIN